MSTADQFVVHTEPVWRDRSDFIINAPLTEEDRPKRFEQLFARQVGDDRFEICCIPFFIFDVALGDIVVTATVRDRKYVVQRVVVSSGRYVFRVWFGESFHPRQEIAQQLEDMGALLEWSSMNLLAVDCTDAAHAQIVADFLAEQQRADRLMYETGRS